MKHLKTKKPNNTLRAVRFTIHLIFKSSSLERHLQYSLKTVEQMPIYHP